MIGRLNLIKSSNNIIEVVPGFDGRIINLPTDLEGTSIKENFSLYASFLFPITIAKYKLLSLK